jgi:hypothetical protein
MTSPSLSSMLFTTNKPTAEDLEPAIRVAASHAGNDDAPRIVSTIVGRVAQAELDVALERACGTKLADILLRGWREFAALNDAAAASIDSPGTEQPVALGDHAITSEQHPEIEVVVAGVPAVTVPLDLVARLELTDVVAVVSGGALAAIRGGRVDVSLELSAAEVRLAAADASLDLDVAFPLPRPIDLRDVSRRTRAVPTPRDGRSSPSA